MKMTLTLNNLLLLSCETH